MDRLLVFLLLLLGVVSCRQYQISGSVLNLTVRPGDNITLYCDCKKSPGVFVEWYRNCSHENQPSLVLGTRFELNAKDLLNPFPRFQLFLNQSSESYDLGITSITSSDEGLYYCGTKQKIVIDEKYITSRFAYKYGNFTTRIIITGAAKEVSGMMVLAPAFSIVSSFLCFILVYHFCQKTDKEPQVVHKSPDTRGQTRWNQEEDVYLTRVVFQSKDGQTHQ